MHLPLSWIAEHIELQGDAQAVCDALTGAGLETEIVSDDRPTWEGVITAKLTSVEAHPDADRLTVTRPFDGRGERTVVCGATNHRVGDIVALATPGTVLPGDLKIKKGKIRGVPSEGMLCSNEELGLGGDADGILILPAETPIGVPLSEVIGAGDVVLDFDATANRGDCLSVLGVARELAAVTGWRLKARRDEFADEDQLNTLVAVAVGQREFEGRVGRGERAVSVRIDAPDGCPRYTAAVMTGVSIGPSPRWLQERLEAAGMRPINNVVDCTNYVMLELGNPLHAFDRRALRGDAIRVRRAEAGEVVRTLDGGQHELFDSDLVISDGVGPTALAGVMGGQHSEVQADTTTLFLESAHFDPATVRATSHRCKLSTESSYRFARGVDPELPHHALSRLIELISRTAGGAVDGATLDLYPNPRPVPPVTLRLSRVAGLLGLVLPPARIFELLERDGLTPGNPEGFVADPPEAIRVQPPSYRFDIEREVDLIEEIARLAGLDELPETLPSRPLRVVPRQPRGLDVDGVRRALVGAGLSEAIHFSFIDPGWLEDLGLSAEHPWRRDAVAVANPLSDVGGILRPTLLPSLLGAVAHNRSMGADDVRLFELRSTFRHRATGFEGLFDEAGRPTGRTAVDERRTVAGVLCGRRNPPGWAHRDEAVDLHDVVAVVEAVRVAVGWKGFVWRAGDLPPFLLPGEGAVLEGLGGRGGAGWMGRIAAEPLRAFGLDVVVYGFELDLSKLAPKQDSVPRFEAFSRFPGAERDLAVLASDAVPGGAVLELAEKAARKAGKGAFQRVSLFDVYRGKGIEAGHRSLALRFEFRALDRTLEDGAVDAVLKKVAAQLSKLDGVSLRQ